MHFENRCDLGDFAGLRRIAADTGMTAVAVEAALASAGAGGAGGAGAKAVVAEAPHVRERELRRRGGRLVRQQVLREDVRANAERDGCRCV